MSDILINGITYSGINSVQIPLASGEGNATYSEGGGGGNAVQIGSATPAPSLLNLFHVLETGACVKGEFTAAKWPSTDEQLLFDSGLETMQGFALFDTEFNVTGASAGNNAFQIVFITDGAAQPGSFSMAAVGSAEGCTKSKPNDKLMHSGNSIAAARVDGGKVYVTPKYAGNASYNGFTPDHKYIWVAW